MKSYLRFLSRNKLYTAIEILGLSVAIAVAVPLLSYLLRLNEVNHAHPHHENIYSLSVVRMQCSSPNIGQYLLENIPEIEIVSSPSHLSGNYTFEVDGKMASYIRYDSNFFYFFPHEFVAGGLDTEAKTAMAVSESFANQISENGNVIGRTLNLGSESYVISGIFKDCQDPRFKKYDMMIPRVESPNEPDMAFWGNNILIMTFFKVQEGTDYDILKKKVQEACAAYWGPMDDKEFENQYSFKRPERYDIVPYSKITTKDNYQLNECGGGGFIIVCVIAVVLLIFAVINYINLNVALSTRRAKEIATRKLVGAGRRQVILLFLREALIMNLICFGVGMLLTGVTTDMISTFFQTVESDGVITVGYSFSDICVYTVFILVLTLVTGLIPASIVSRFTPLDIAKGNFRYHSKKTMTKVFICIQTILTVLLLAVTLIFNAQYDKYMDMEYNCDIDDVFFLMPDYGVNLSPETLKSELEKRPEVIAVGHSNRVPSSLTSITYESTNGDRIYLSCVECTEEAFEIFGFDIMTVNDTTNLRGIWMTPEAVKTESIYPEYFKDLLSWNFGDYRIAGMIENIPTGDGQNNIDDFPAVVVVADAKDNSMVIKTIDDHEKARKAIASVYEEVTGIEVQDLREFGMTSMYIKEINEDGLAPWKGLNDLLEKLLGFIFILGVMGLTGISIYFATEREKEIAIRKVFGGTSESELKRNLMTFVKITLIANLIAIPLAAAAFSTIMFSFADKITNIWIIYVVCVLISFAISLGSVLWQTIRAARTNPAEALKKE
ncbi:MAG: ABC transporter permease [Bacteroidales bacterium]|nr:ABC transporter permease [Bacteroidales bacterium]